MSAVHTGIYTYLSSVTAVTTILGTPPRLYPQRAPTSAAAPYCIYQRSGAEHQHHQVLAAGLNNATIQFDCYADSSVEAQALSEALRGALDGMTLGTWGALEVKRVMLLNESDAFISFDDGSENGRFRVTMDFALWHAESVPAL